MKIKIKSKEEVFFVPVYSHYEDWKNWIIIKDKSLN